MILNAICVFMLLCHLSEDGGHTEYKEVGYFIQTVTM